MATVACGRDGRNDALEAKAEEWKLALDDRLVRVRDAVKQSGYGADQAGGALRRESNGQTVHSRAEPFAPNRPVVVE